MDSFGKVAGAPSVTLRISSEPKISGGGFLLLMVQNSQGQPSDRLDGAKTWLIMGINYRSLNWFSRRISEPSTVGPIATSRHEFVDFIASIKYQSMTVQDEFAYEADTNNGNKRKVNMK